MSKSRFQSIRSLMIKEMCDAGELERKSEDTYEDMGGHIIHESNDVMDSYIENFLKNMDPDERRELCERVASEAGDL